MPSGFLDDPRLSWDAKGMLSYLLANKKADFDVSDLLKRSTNGRDSTLRRVNELIKHGYILRERLRNADGQYCGLKHFIYPHGRKPID